MITLYFQTSMADRRSHRGKEKSKGKGWRYFSKPPSSKNQGIVRLMQCFNSA